MAEKAPAVSITEPPMQDALDQFKRDLAKAERKHSDRVRKYEAADDAYNARLTPYDRSTIDGEDWRSDLHPPYVFQTVQTIKALLVDDKPIATVSPPKGKPELKDKAQAYENVLNEQRRDDQYDQKWDEYVLQGLQRGVSIAKVAWEVRRAKVRQQSMTPVYGSVLPDRSIKEVEQTITNRPTLIVCDAKDVMWDPAATSAESITTLFYRTYETKSSLRQLEKDGVYENVDDVEGAGQQGTDRPGARDVKDLVEVIERWQKRPDGVWLTVVANRACVLRDEASPFIHQELPFVFCAPTPQLFRVEGKSEPELISDLQAALWQTQNQRLDNVELINNVIAIFPESTQNIDDMVVKPGARWLKQMGSEPIQFWNPPPGILQPAIQAEELMKGDMNDISAASPYVSGADSQTVDNKTATGISLVQNMAVKRVMQKKQRFADAERAVGRLQLQLNEQLAPDLLPAYGPMGEPMPLRIQDIIGCTYEVEDASESLNRQERRTEASLMLQTIAGLAAIPQVGMIINWRMWVEKYIEAFDDDPAQLLLAPPPALGVPGALPVAPGQMGSPQMGGGLASAPPAGGVPPGMAPTPAQAAGVPGPTPFAQRLQGQAP